MISYLYLHLNSCLFLYICILKAQKYSAVVNAKLNFLKSIALFIMTLEELQPNSNKWVITYYHIYLDFLHLSCTYLLKIKLSWSSLTFNSWINLNLKLSKAEF